MHGDDVKLVGMQKAQAKLLALTALCLMLLLAASKQLFSFSTVQMVLSYRGSSNGSNFRPASQHHVLARSNADKNTDHIPARSKAENMPDIKNTENVPARSNTADNTMPVLSSTPSAMETSAENRTKTQASAPAIVCLFGVVNRSIKRTWKTIVKHLIQPLKLQRNNVSLYVFDINVSGHLVDAQLLAGPTDSFSQMMWNETELLDEVIIESARQDTIDELVALRCRKHLCKLRYDDEPDYRHLTKNAFRQMYAESAVARFLRARVHEYSVAVASGPDFAYIQDLPPVIRADDANVIYLTTMNEGEGYTNGFYAGHPEAVAKVMCRFDEYEHYASIQRDYERTVMAAVQRHNLTRRVVDMPFCKVRANGNVWAGPGFPAAGRIDECSSA